MIATAIKFMRYDRAKSIGIIIGIVISIFLIGQQLGILTFLMGLMGGLVDNSREDIGEIWVVDNITENANELAKLDERLVREIRSIDGVLNAWPVVVTGGNVKFSNGNRFIARPGSAKTSRGKSAVTLLLEDEAAWVDDLLKRSVSPMLAVSGGRYIMMSTPFGKRGHFFDTWTTAKGWEKYEISAHQCPRISREFLQQELDDGMPELFWKQEYFNQFTDTDSQLFSYDIVAQAFTSEVQVLAIA